MILLDKIMAFKQENILAERIHGLDPQMERKGDENAAESVRDAIGFEYGLSSSKGWTNIIRVFNVLVVAHCMEGYVRRGLKLEKSSLMNWKWWKSYDDKVVLIKENLKETRDRQKSYADNRHKLLDFKVADQVLLKVSP
ncbi:hypothetical protein Tco_0549028 [Tanacetum coccineum]